MDDLVSYVLEEVACDGSLGTSIPRLWSFVEDYHRKECQDHSIDQSYKDYLWPLLTQCDDFLVGRKSTDANGITSITPSSRAAINTVELVDRNDDQAVVYTTDSRQWLTIAGHQPDYKQIPPMAFACLSAISASRSAGICLIDLYRQTGQDKRSAPARCKRLAAQGLVHGFPVLVQRSNTTLYVHHRFLDDNKQHREGQLDYGGKSQMLDLNRVRKDICDLLLKSTNQILKVVDCCTLMGMRSSQVDKWTQRRFYQQIRLLAANGYVRLIKVPGKLTSSLIRCVQLLKEYDNTGNSLLRHERRQILQIRENEDTDDEEDGADAAKLEIKEDLDLSDPRTICEWTAPAQALVAKDVLLESTISQAIIASGDAGIAGPDLRRLVVGKSWARPFDEQIKRICPDLTLSTQPRHYASLAPGPAFQETVKTRQYRYYSRTRAVKLLPTDKTTTLLDCDESGELPALERSAQFLKSSALTKKLKSSKKKVQGKSQKGSVDQVSRSATPLNDTELVTSKNTTLATPSFTDSTETGPYQSHSTKKRSSVSVLAPCVAKKRISQVEDHVDTVQAGMVEGLPIPEVVIDTPTVPVITPRSSNSKRDLLRKTATNSTTAKRKALLHQIIISHNGIVALGPALVNEYDKLSQRGRNVLQATDKSTLKRALDDMVADEKLFQTVRLIPNHTGRVHIRKDIYFSRDIDPSDSRIDVFVQDLKMAEASKQPSGAPHTVLEVITRPVMDVIPSMAQRESKSRKLRPLNLSKDQLDKLRIRLAEKATTNHPDKSYSWYTGEQRLLSSREQLLMEKKRFEASGAVGGRKPKVNKIKPIRKTLLEIPGSGISSATSHLAYRNRGIEFDNVQPGNTSDDEPPNTPEIRTRRSKKFMSKRADRFEDDEEELNIDSTEGLPQIRTRLAPFNDSEDDALVRVANLSMLFFSKHEQLPNIDWEVTQSSLQERHQEVYRKRYATIRSRPKHKATHDFIQSAAFAEMYNRAVRAKEIDAVPSRPIDAHGKPYNILWLVEFTKCVESTKSLASAWSFPQDINQLYASFAIAPESSPDNPDWKDNFFSGIPSTLKISALTSGALCVLDEKGHETASEAAHLRSIIKSILLTGADTYDVDKATRLIAQYSTTEHAEEILRAMLQENLVIGAKTDALRRLPGRNYSLSDKFFSKFRLSLETTTLKMARGYANGLQETFKSSTSATFPYVANDGTAAAALELAIRGYIDLEQGPKKWGKHGLIHDYAVRQIEASVLDFDVLFTPTEKSWPIFDDLMASPDSREPCFWIDVNGVLMPAVYQKVMALIISLLVSRGRLSIEELLRLTKPVFELHELQQCLRAMEAGRFIQHREELYEVMDQYFYCIK